MGCEYARMDNAYYPGHGNGLEKIPEVHRWAYDYGKDGREFIQQTEPIGANESKH